MNKKSFNPGSTIGILGGGQLGRMSAIAARNMGYNIHIFDPVPHSPAGQIADREINAPYTDTQALTDFASKVDLVTLEFENIPVEALNTIEKQVPVNPSAEILYIAQNRQREKDFLKENGFPVPPYAIVESEEELTEAIKTIGTPSVLKTADFGYDGKGQTIIALPEQSSTAWKKLSEFSNDAPRGILEGWVDFRCELSVICARNASGQSTTFPVAENTHANHILDFSIVPPRIPEDILSQARELAQSIADKLQIIGILAVEMFYTSKGTLLINELAPRPHNSGHYSQDACITSQFEQHIRAICNLPLGSTKLISPAVMLNLLGDIWLQDPSDKPEEPEWNQILTQPTAKLHLYGKSKPINGRKMGHVNILGHNNETALRIASSLRSAIYNTER